MSIRFVNRSKEFEFLQAQKNFIGIKNSVVLLCGNSGVGKSELTKRFIQYSNKDIPSLKVSIQQAEKNTYDAGYYLTKLARTIHEQSNIDSRINSLSDFFKENKLNNVIVKKFWENFKTDILSSIPLSNTIKGIADLFSNEGEFEVKNFFESTHSDILLALFEYVRNECMRTNLIINIENIQSIDRRSLELIIPIIKFSNNCLFLLEFTDNDDTGYTFYDITSQFEDQEIICEILPIKPLNIQDVQKLIEGQPGISWQLIEKAYLDWNGNMRSMVDLLTKVKYGLPLDSQLTIDINSATLYHLHSLSSSEIFTLVTILAHTEPVHISLLNNLITYNESMKYIIDVHAILITLEEHLLITRSKDEIALAHDSIAQNLTSTYKFDLYIVVAQRFWLDTYEKLLRIEDLFTSRGWILMKVLYFVSLLHNDSRIYELLAEVSNEALRSRDPEKMLRYVEDVRDGLVKKDQMKYSNKILQLNYWLVELYYKVGNSSDAWRILSKINDNSRKYNVLRAILLEQVGYHSDAIDVCNNELESLNTWEPNYELALRLVRLVTNYDIGNTKYTADQFEFLYENPQYKDLFEYGFLLRNAELVFNYCDSLPYYQKSITHFLNHGAVRQAAFSRITYGVHLGLVGQYNLARDQFRLAEKQLGDVISERHSLLNNLAVLLLFEKKINSNADELLRTAMLTAVNDFERLTIVMNYLVFMDWNDKRTEVELSISSILKILEKPTFASKEIIRYVYFNLYKYFDRIGDENKSIDFIRKINELNLVETPIWKFWLYNEPIAETDDEYFLSAIDRPISFLCNWNMEYDSHLMQY